MSGHTQVEHEDVGAEGPDGLDGRRAVRTRGHDVEIRIPFEKTLQAVKHDRVIVGENQADRHVSAPRRAGRRSRSAP